MHPLRACVRVLLFLLLVCLTCIEASSILGCATVGARSHHMNVLRIGRELVGRGHNFTMLVSSTDAISLDTVGSRGFPGLHVVQFKVLKLNWPLEQNGGQQVSPEILKK